MSLTSYRAAPPRAKTKKTEGWNSRPVSFDCNEGYVIASMLCRPGDDLLSRDLRRSTIGPGRLNDRVRNGIGWGPSGIATRSTKTRLFVNREDIVELICKVPRCARCSLHMDR